MFIELALAGGLLALLVLMGRRPARARLGLRAIRTLVGVLSVWFGQGAGRRPGDEQGVGGMNLDQARAILGVGPSATRAEIEAAYRRLIRRAHPDQGGTSGLAAQLNAARDRLVK
ncbi:MAG: DnaJ domain-containing protein [Pseudomonadota bacterium]|nr:DnaJ domain-containing protein [Pseudomonadota bacterium]